MPVMTRSQRLKQQQLLAQQQQNEQIEGSRSVSISASNLKCSSQQSKEEKSEEALSYKSNANQFRDYVQTLLDSPNSNKMSRKPMVVAPSPRIERITISNKKNQQMEFLIPPKENDSAIEIREQIRAALYSPNSKPETVPFDAPKTTSSSSSIYNDTTKLLLKEKDSERISRWLITIIFTILTAVFIACYKEEIVTFLQVQLTPMAQFANQCWEWIVLNVNELWHEMMNSVNTMFENEMVKDEDIETAII